MFLENSVTQKVNMLYYIDVMGSDIKVKDILKFLSISQNTLKKYIIEINTRIDNYHIHYKGNRIRSSMNQEKTSTLATQEVLKESINLKIFFEIFRYEPTLSELSEKLFLSRTTILNKINLINSSLKKQNFPMQVESNKICQIIGDEQVIRSFLAIMLVEIGDYEILAPYEPLLVEVHRFIDHYFPTKPSFYQSVLIECQLYVSIIRTSQRHLAYSTMEDVPKDINREIKLIYNYFSKKKYIINFLEKCHNMSYTPLITANTINVKLIRSRKILYNGMGIDSEKNHKIKKCLEGYCKQFNVVLSNDEKKEFLEFLYKKKYLMGSFNQIFLKEFEIHFMYLKERAPNKILYMLKRIDELKIFDGERFSTIYEFIIFFVLFNKRIRLNFFNLYVPSKKNILIHCSKQAIVAEIFAHVIKDKYGDKFYFEIDYTKTIYDSVEYGNYDVIVSDIYKDVFFDKYVYLPMIPNEKFWIDFENKLIYQ